MSLKFNGVEIPTSGTVTWNGAEFNEVKFNGVTFWEKGSASLPAPEWIAASDGTFPDKIQVHWDAQLTGVYWHLYRDDVEIAEITDGSSFYNDTQVSQNTIYVYKIQACMPDGTLCSPMSPSDSGYLKTEDTETPPTEAPQNLAASDGTSYTYVNITWDNGSEPAASHIRVERSDDDGATWITIANLVFGTSAYQDISALSGTTYTYRAVFYNSGGDGPYSNEDTGYKAEQTGDCPDYSACPVPPQYVQPQGSSSGLDADLLDGKEAADFALDGHTHSEYSPIGHDHDSDYSPIGHNHDGAYAPANHNHDGEYHPYAGSTGIQLKVPTTPVDSNDAASKAYVDSQGGGTPPDIGVGKIHCFGACDTGGQIYAFGCSVVYNGGGIYAITFSQDAGTLQYVIVGFAGSQHNDDFLIRNKTTTSCEVKFGDGGENHFAIIVPT